MQQFKLYFEDTVQKDKIKSLKKGKSKFKKRDIDRLRSPGPVGNQQSFNLGQSNVIDTAFKSTSTFVPRG